MTDILTEQNDKRIRFRSDFKVASLPVPIVDADKDANLRFVEDAVASLPEGTDLLVLPELFSTGFVSDRDSMAALAEDSDGPTMGFVAGLARSLGCAVAGTFAAREGDSLFNRGFIAEPAGETAFYDKHHLFSLSDEHLILTPGTSQPTVVRFRGFNISMVVCYDIRFPVWCRNVGARYDLLLCPSNWPAKRAFAWEHLLQARAIENEAYVVGADRGGEDRYGSYDGQSYVFDYRGKRVDSDGGLFRVADLSRDDLARYRHAFPFLADQDPFSL